MRITIKHRFLGVLFFSVLCLGVWSGSPCVAAAQKESGIAAVNVSAEALAQKPEVAKGNRCELVTFVGLGHSYNSSRFGEAGKAAEMQTRENIATFLTSQGQVENPKSARTK